MNSNRQPTYRSVTDTCEHYGISRTALYRLLSQRLVKAKKFGPKTLIDAASSDAYFAALPDAKIHLAEAPPADEARARG